MAKSVNEKIRNLERRLRKEFNADAHFPDGVPAELRLTMLEQAYEEVREEQKDPEYAEMKQLFGEMHTTIDFCGGWCPGCEILQWCESPRESYSEEDIRWMKEHNDYPDDAQIEV